ncbi:MAG TPA: ABC transporter, partial [Marmoricola sp.]|nr:ABC transporter [Marmoricola sp.]
RAASTANFADLSDQLDRVITQTDLGMERTPLWCRFVRFLQWVLLLLAIGGLGWLGVLAVLAWLRLPEPTTPSYAGIPIPTLMLGVGVLVGLLLALASRALISVGARSRAAQAQRQLNQGVAEVAQKLVLEPIDTELNAYEAFYTGLKSARRS